MFHNRIPRVCIVTVAGASLTLGAMSFAAPANATAAADAPAAPAPQMRATLIVTSPDTFTPGQRPTFAGRAYPGETVTIKRAWAGPVGVVADDSGAWSWTEDQPWDAHPRTVTFSGIFQTIERTFVPDGSKDFALAETSPFVPGTTPTFSGTGAIGDEIVVGVVNVAGNTRTTVRDDGTWSVAAPYPLGERPYGLRVRAVTKNTTITRVMAPEGSKNLGFSTPQTFVPGEPLLLQGTGAIGDELLISTPRNDFGTVVVGSDGHWRFEGDEWAPAGHSITITSELTGASAQQTFRPAASKPFGIDGPDQITPGEQISISGTGTVGDDVVVKLPSFLNETVRVARDGTWRVDSGRAWARAPHRVTAEVQGSDVRTSKLFVPAGSKPLTVTTPQTFTPDKEVVLTGTGTIGDQLEITLPNRSTVNLGVGPDARWTHTIAGGWKADEQTVTITSRATGESATETFTPEAAAVAQIVVTTMTFTTGQKQKIEGTAEPGARVDVYSGSKYLMNVAADKDGNWDYTTGAAITDDIFTRTLKTKGAKDVTFTLTAEQSTVAPITVTTKTFTTGQKQKIEGTAQPGARVNVYFGTKYLMNVTADKDGNWNYTTGAAITDGTFTRTLKSAGSTDHTFTLTAAK